MNYLTRTAVATAAVMALGACGTTSPSGLPAGAQAYQAFGQSSRSVAETSSEDEVIRINDRLAIRVLGEPDISGDGFRVDANGLVQMPLAGEMVVAGKTPNQVRAEVTRRLGARYIRDPQVAVVVVERARSTFAVEGAVREPGVFEANPDTTLLAALAQAKSPTNVARTNEVIIFRQINGERMGARFSLGDIRNGRASDPRVLAGDTIVVGHSNLKSAWREFLQAVPAFNVFYVFKSL